ncbi:MAG: hypothetical protein OEZ31_02870, partial [Nitrospirota bacterium]|nr:hypothetical protein [Nitrospirota bacterium]
RMLSFLRKQESRRRPRESGELKELDSRFHRKPWIPHQVRNDKQGNPVVSLHGISSLNMKCALYA